MKTLFNIKTLAFFCFILFLTIDYCFSQEEKITVFEIKNEDGSIDFFAKNTHSHSFTAEVTFDVLTNYKSSVSLPFKGEIEAKKVKKYLFTITPTTSSNIKYSYSCSYASASQSTSNNDAKLPEFDNCTEEKHTGLCVTLSEFNSEDLDTSLFEYEWVLGDGNKKTGNKIKHCYTDYGEYTIKLNVFDKFTNEHLYNVATEEIYLKRENGLFFDIPLSARVNEKVVLENVIADVKGYDNDNIYWDFGDGYKAMGNKESHIFAVEGEYTVKMGLLSVSGNEKQCIYKRIIIMK